MKSKGEATGARFLSSVFEELGEARRLGFMHFRLQLPATSASCRSEEKVMYAIEPKARNMTFGNWGITNGSVLILEKVKNLLLRTRG